MKLLPAFNLRLPPDVRKELERCARENERSLNAEIVYRLRRSLDGWRQ
jgi:hypothetical protein